MASVRQVEQARLNSSYSGNLITTTRYSFPLQQHIFSLSPSYPVRLHWAPSPTVPPISRKVHSPRMLFSAVLFFFGKSFEEEELLKALAMCEDSLRKAGYDPYTINQRLQVNTSSDYQDELVAYLKEAEAISDDGARCGEQWRKDIFSYKYLRRGWKRIESLGKEREWLLGVETEAQWADLVKRVNRWQEEREPEERQRKPFVPIGIL